MMIHDCYWRVERDSWWMMSNHSHEIQVKAHFPIEQLVTWLMGAEVGYAWMHLEEAVLRGTCPNHGNVYQGTEWIKQTTTVEYNVHQHDPVAMYPVHLIVEWINGCKTNHSSGRCLLLLFCWFLINHDCLLCWFLLGFVGFWSSRLLVHCSHGIFAWLAPAPRCPREVVPTVRQWFCGAKSLFPRSGWRGVDGGWVAVGSKLTKPRSWTAEHHNFHT